MAARISKADQKGLTAENASLRSLLSQAQLNAARLIKQSGIEAAQNETAIRLQTLLLEELHHRIKNTLAMVMALTSQTLRTTQNVEEGRLAIESRLMAMGRAQDLLLSTKWASAKLHDVIEAATNPFDQKRVFRSDLDVDVGASSILPLTMMLNELATNAVKYGALSAAAGRIDIKPEVNGERFNLSWIESGGPAVKAPARTNFGTRLMSRLASQLEGAVQLDYRPTGLRVLLDVPLQALQSTSP